jgi:hypothetical protein
VWPELDTTAAGVRRSVSPMRCLSLRIDCPDVTRVDGGFISRGLIRSAGTRIGAVGVRGLTYFEVARTATGLGVLDVK